jgi:hypothetical protein
MTKFIFAILFISPIFCFSQKVEMVKWGPTDRLFSLELLVSVENIDTYNIDGKRYLSISDKDFTVITRAIDSLNLSQLTLSDVSKPKEFGSFGVTVISEDGLREYFLSSADESRNFFLILSQSIQNPKVRQIFMDLSQSEIELNTEDR